VPSDSGARQFEEITEGYPTVHELLETSWIPLFDLNLMTVSGRQAIR